LLLLLLLLLSASAFRLSPLSTESSQFRYQRKVPGDMIGIVTRPLIITLSCSSGQRWRAGWRHRCDIEQRAQLTQTRTKIACFNPCKNSDYYSVRDNDTKWQIPVKEFSHERPLMKIYVLAAIHGDW